MVLSGPFQPGENTVTHIYLHLLRCVYKFIYFHTFRDKLLASVVICAVNLAGTSNFALSFGFIKF